MPRNAIHITERYDFGFFGNDIEFIMHKQHTHTVFILRTNAEAHRLMHRASCIWRALTELS